MDFKLEKGLSSRTEMVVTEKDTARNVGSGSVRVFATPIMIGLMENAAVETVDAYLPKGYATVGTRIDVRHMAATPIGMKVYATVQLTGVYNRRMEFKVEAYDEKEKIGEGVHERYIVSIEQFMEKAEAKL